MSSGSIIGCDSLAPTVSMMLVIRLIVGVLGLVVRAMSTMEAMAVSIHHTML